MFTPDTLADRITPAAGVGQPYALQLVLADAGMELAEKMLDLVPRGEHQDAAVDGLARALNRAYVGIDPTYVPPATDEPVPYEVIDRTLTLDVAVWRLGVMNSPLHPLSRLVALVLSESCGPTGFIPDGLQPTLVQHAQRTGLSLQVLHPHLADVVVQGWASRHAVVEHGVRRTLYQLRLPRTRVIEPTP
jgi:hypothetical protein